MEKLDQLKISNIAGFLIILLLNYTVTHASINESSALYNKAIKYTWGIVNENGINIRQYPGTYSKVLKVCNKYTGLIVTGKYKKWYQIKYGSGTAWIYSMYLDGYYLPLIPEVNPKIKEALLRQEIVHYAKQFVGTPYKYGGTNLKTGVDCSGFTQSVMKNFDIPLHRSARDQIKNGAPVKRDELCPADLVFFDTSGSNNGKISHVGIYIGNNQIIHATTSKGVKIDELSQNYYQKTYVKSASVLKIK